MTFYTAIRETGDIIDSFDTLNGAREEIKRYEEVDKADGCYTEDAYDIVSGDHQSYLSYERFKDFDSGKEYHLEKLEKEYNDHKLEIDYDTFEEWLDKMLDLGRQGIGCLVEI